MKSAARFWVGFTAAAVLLASSGGIAHDDANLGPRDQYKGKGYFMKAETVAAVGPITPDEKTFRASFIAETVLLLDRDVWMPADGDPKAAYISAQLEGKTFGRIGPKEQPETIKGFVSAGNWREFGKTKQGELVLEWTPAFWFSFGLAGIGDGTERINDHEARVELGLVVQDGGSVHDEAKHQH